MNKIINMIWYIRVLIFYFFICIISVLCFVGFCLPLKLININYHFKYNIAKKFSELFITLGKIICGLNYKVSGLEKLPSSPSLVLSNHQSFWDNVFMQIIIPEHSWIVKRQLFNIPFFGWALKCIDPIAVDRTDNFSVKQILLEGQKKLKAGLWLIIFPESTRLKPEETAKFKPSAVKLGMITKVPLVLIAHNAGVYWPKGFWIKKSGTILVEVLDVIYPHEAETHDVRTLTSHIEQLINASKQRLFEQSNNSEII